MGLLDKLFGGNRFDAVLNPVMTAAPTVIQRKGEEIAADYL